MLGPKGEFKNGDCELGGTARKILAVSLFSTDGVLLHDVGSAPPFDFWPLLVWITFASPLFIGLVPGISYQVSPTLIAQWVAKGPAKDFVPNTTGLPMLEHEENCAWCCYQC